MQEEKGGKKPVKETLVGRPGKKKKNKKGGRKGLKSLRNPGRSGGTGHQISWPKESSAESTQKNAVGNAFGRMKKAT